MPGTPATTSRHAIPRYGDLDPADIGAIANSISDRIDVTAPVFQSGLLAARPSTGAGIADRFYFATDDTSGGPSGTLYRDAGGATPTWQRINPANAEAAFSTWKLLKAGAVTIPTQGAGGTFGAGLWQNVTLYTLNVANGTAAYAFVLDPSDHLAGTRTTKLRLRTQYMGNPVAPGINMVAEVRPVTNFNAGTSGQTPGIGATGAALIGNTYTTPAANAYTVITSAEVTFPASAAPYVFTVTLGGAMAAGSVAVITYELQMRQV